MLDLYGPVFVIVFFVILSLPFIAIPIIIYTSRIHCKRRLFCC